MAARAVSMDDLRLYIKKGRKKERERQRERERERKKDGKKERKKEREREKKMRFTGRQSTHCNPKYRRWNRLPCHLAGSANADS